MRLLALVIGGVIAGVLQLPGLIIAVATAVHSLETDNVVRFTFGAELAIRLSALVATTITAPFTAGVLALLYIDRRMRAEALDVTLARAAREAGAE